MATDSGRPPLLVRFFDSFLQERNIKWVLALGMLILLSSSLLLVSMQWNRYASAEKQLVFLVYTALLHGAGYWTYHRLGLRRTGIVLQGLTVLLIPILFLAWQWNPLGKWREDVTYLLLLAATSAFAFTAARQICTHLLRGEQRTFLFCYFFLALAGTLPRGLTEFVPALASLLLWAVFAIGTVKVNRHVFWLMEEQRKPRIFGFFPILLLGAEFLALFVLHGAPHLELPWFGFGCALISLPVLLTADTLASVFQRRTGDLVRPLPWSILLPLGVGLMLCAAGVILAGLGLRPPTPQGHALVLSSALVAVMMALVARRTGKTTFVWAMLCGVLLTYNFSPAFFIDLAREVLGQAAFMVGEEKLPLAFYGLTNLPLVCGVLVASQYAARVRADVFVGPLRLFAFGLSLVLLGISLGHVKATLPVGLVMTAVFALQVALFRDWRPAVAAIVAWMLAALGLVPFLAEVLDMTISSEAQLCALSVAAGSLLLAGRRLDPILARLAPTMKVPRQALCHAASLVLTLALALGWCVQHVIALRPDGAVSGILLVALLGAHGARWMHPALLALALLFGQALFVQQTIQNASDHVLMFVALLLLGQWALHYMLEGTRNPLVKMFAAINYRVVLVEMTLFCVGVVMPGIIIHLLQPLSETHVPAWLDVGGWCALLVLAWCFDAARREALAPLGILGCIGVLVLAGAMFLDLGGDLWCLPAVWSSLALAAVPVAEMLHRRLEVMRTEENSQVACWEAVSVPLHAILLGVFLLVEFASLLTFPWEMRIAGGISLVGLAALAALRRSAVRSLFLLLLNWQILCGVVCLCVPGLNSIFDLRHGKLIELSLPLACAAAASLLFWQLVNVSTCPPWTLVVKLHEGTMAAFVIGCMCRSLALKELDPLAVVLAGSAFLLACASLLVRAVRRQSEEHVWTAEAIVLVACAYMLWFQVITVGSGLSMFVVLGVALVLWLGREIAALNTDLKVLVRPFDLTARILPGVAVLLGVGHHSFGTTWRGANSLALLLAGGFYFWRGIEERRKSLILLAGGILNIALILLWRELTLSDPQLFMIPIGLSFLGLVQLLKEEIPGKFHDPLRYAGALLILVSPTFHIVGGSWIHLFSLMVASVGVVILAIGLRVRALMYMGTAFLLADLVAIVVRGSIDNPNVLWLAGLLFGAAVLALGAVCERNREDVMQRMRTLAENLKQWE